MQTLCVEDIIGVHVVKQSQQGGYLAVGILVAKSTCYDSDDGNDFTRGCTPKWGKLQCLLSSTLIPFVVILVACSTRRSMLRKRAEAPRRHTYLSPKAAEAHAQCSLHQCQHHALPFRLLRAISLKWSCGQPGIMPLPVSIYPK